MPFGYPDTFEVEPLAPKPSPWLNAPVLFDSAPTLKIEDHHKKAFALEWAKLPGDPFKAACIIFGTDATSALWAARNWILDPEVNAIKDQYLKASEATENLLDKKAFAARLLRISEEKSESGRYLVEAKDRLKALELYAKTMGYMNDAVINNNIDNSTTNNELKIVFVEPDHKEEIKTIEHVPDDESEILEGAELPFEIKLVG